MPPSRPLFTEVSDDERDEVTDPSAAVFSVDSDNTAMRFQEEIMGIIQRCDTRQLKGIREIAEIYVDGTRLKD